VRRVVGDSRCRHLLDIVESFVVPSGSRGTPLVPVMDVIELFSTDRGLQFVQSVVEIEVSVDPVLGSPVP